MKVYVVLHSSCVDILDPFTEKFCHVFSNYESAKHFCEEELKKSSFNSGKNKNPVVQRACKEAYDAFYVAESTRFEFYSVLERELLE